MTQTNKINHQSNLSSRWLLVDGYALINEIDDFVDDRLLLIVHFDFIGNGSFGGAGRDGGLRFRRFRLLTLALLEALAQSQK